MISHFRTWKKDKIFNIWLSNICIRKAGNIIPSNIFISKAGKNTNYSQKIQASLTEPSQSSPILSSKHINNKIAPDLNIFSYYLKHLSSLDISTWHTTCGNNNQTIKIRINKHYRRTVERTWKMVNYCLEKGVQYTGKESNLQVDLTF